MMMLTENAIVSNKPKGTYHPIQHTAPNKNFPKQIRCIEISQKSCLGKLYTCIACPRLKHCNVREITLIILAPHFKITR